MASKTKRGLSYVLGNSDDNENHILPANALQFRGKSSQLVSAGRDGAVKVWASAEAQRGVSSFGYQGGMHNVRQKNNHQLGGDIHEDILKLETSITSNRLDTGKSSHNAFRITSNYNIHFDWINDMKLVGDGNALVTCSSDLSLKLINLASNSSEGDHHRPKTEDIHKFSNVHTDYIRKLTYNRANNVLTSGGLDGKMVSWDLHRLSPVQEITNLNSSSTSQNSIYSLAGNTNLLSVGGPGNLINIYDRRIDGSSSFVKSLIGHQDNIKCLLMNEKFALSGSSDNTIKLWDLRNFKVYRNFEMHDSPVWSICTAFSSSEFSGHLSGEDISDFSIFYSGDKNGNLFKTDLSYLSHHIEENYLPESFTFSTNESSIIDEKLGVCTYIAKSKSPIISLCVEPDTGNSSGEDLSIFASTYNAIEHYSLPNTKRLSQYQHLRACIDFSINNDHQLNDDSATGLNDGNEQNDLGSDLYDLVSHLSMDSNNYDIQSSFSGNNHPMSTYNTDPGYPNDRDYFSIFIDTHGGPSGEFINVFDETVNPFDKDIPSISESTVEILLNPIPEEQVNLVPFNTSTINTYNLSHKSIISKRLFNNKRHILVLCSNGDIKIWDLFLCRMVKDFAYQSKEQFELTKEKLEKRQKEMDEIFHTYQTMHTLNNWCDVEIKSGKLMVTLTESSFVKAEIYYDELVREYPFLDLKSADSGHNNDKQVVVSNDDRYFISRILLHSFFHRYELFELKYDNSLRDELVATKKLKGANPVEDGPVLAESTSSNGTLRKFKQLGKRQSKTNVTGFSSSRQSPVVSETASINGSVTIDSVPTVELLEDKLQAIKEGSSKNTEGQDPSQTENSIYSMLSLHKKKYMEQLNSHKTISSVLNIYSNSKIPTSQENSSISYTPLIRPQRFPDDLQITILEYSSDMGNFRDLATFALSEINRIPLDEPQTDNSLVNNLRLYLPRWIGEPLLYDKFPEADSQKIAFQLLEYDYMKLPPHKKIGGKSQRKIKKLPVVESSIKLNSHNMLRVGKIITYLTEKFDSKTSEMKDKKPPSEWLAIECKDQELPLDMTLQTIKTRIWKSSSDIELYFRRKFDS